jgi:hypothetical protein
MSWPTITPIAALRNNLRAKNVHRLDTIADESKNDMARVASIKALEQITEQAEARSPSGATQLPGIQIVIVQRETVAGRAESPVISVEPTPAMLAP